MNLIILRYDVVFMLKLNISVLFVVFLGVFSFKANKTNKNVEIPVFCSIPTLRGLFNVI